MSRRRLPLPLRHGQRWTLVALVGFIALTSLLGNASAAGAREPAPLRPAAPIDDPNWMEQIEGRWCGSSNGSGSWLNPIGLTAKIMKATSFCDGAQQAAGKVYCNSSSLLSLFNPNIGLGAPNGAPAVQGAPNWGDAGQLTLNAVTPGQVKLVMDQLNGKWYTLDEAKWNKSEATKWYPQEAKDEAINKGNCELLQHPPSLTCEDIRKLPEEEQNKEKRDGILPDDCVGTYPSANYNISYDGGNVISVDRKIWGGLTGLMFNIGKASVQVATWSIGKAFKVNLADYTGLSTAISDRYNKELVGPFSIEAFAWLALMGFVAITALRGKLGMAGGEFLMAIVMLGIAQVLLANQADYMNSTSTLINEASNSLFRIANTGKPDAPGEPPATVPSKPGDPPSAYDKWWDQALLPLKKTIHVEFVEKPYEYLNWGTVRENIEGDCGTRVDRITQIGATGDDGWSWQYLGKAKSGDCDPIVAYNRSPTATRFLGALFTMLIALFVGVTFTLISITVLVSKITVAILFALAPFALALAAAPGSGRRVFFVWGFSILQCGAAAIGSGCLLSMTLMADDVILKQTQHDPTVSLMERWSIMFILVVFIYYARRQLSQGTKSLVGRTADSFTKFSPAAAGWQGNGSGGIDLSSVDRGAQRAGFYARHAGYYGAIAAGSGAVLTARSINHRLVERRVARRALRNLEIMKQRDGDSHLETEIKMPTISKPDGTQITRTVIRKTRMPSHNPAVRGGGNINFLGRSNLKASADAQGEDHARFAGVTPDRRTALPVNPHPPHTRPVHPRTPPERVRPNRSTRSWFDPRKYSVLPRQNRRWRR